MAVFGGIAQLSEVNKSFKSFNKPIIGVGRWLTTKRETGSYRLFLFWLTMSFLSFSQRSVSLAE